MMALLFIILFIATLLAWYGHRSYAQYTYVISLVLSVIWFLHHVTSSLAIQL
jgi:hypothetical protein